MAEYSLIAEQSGSTVASEAPKRSAKEPGGGYQSEADLEDLLVKQLAAQGYGLFEAGDEQALIANLRKQLETLNVYAFTESEWRRFYAADLGNPSNHIVQKTRMIQQDHIRLLERDNGEVKNIYLLDKKSIHNNSLQVMRQYTAKGGEVREPLRRDDPRERPAACAHRAEAAWGEPQGGL